MLKRNTAAIRVMAYIILFVAGLVLSGWYFDVPALISITPNMTAMNPVTALNFSLVAIWLLITAAASTNTAATASRRLIAIWILFVGVFKLLEYAHLITSAHIDRFLFPARLALRPGHNAIAPTSCTLFFFCGIIMLDVYGAGKLQKLVKDALLFLSFVLAYMGIIGYIYSLEPFYRIGPFVPMALNTACCFIVLIVGLLLSFPHGHLSTVLFSRNIGGTLVRRAIPLTLLVPPAFGYFRLFIHRAQFYNIEYSVALDTGFFLLIVLLLIFYYAGVLNRKDNERKLAEKILVQSEEKYRSLVDALKEGIVYYNRQCHIIFCNPSFAQMMGYTAEELIGKNLIDTMTPEEQREKAKKRMADRLSGIPEDYEGRLLHKDGRAIQVYITARPMAKQGEDATFLSTVMDITERKKKEEDIEAFSASAAHDLNAPLARVEMLANYLMDMSGERLNAEDTEMLGHIVKTTVDMRALLKDLLLFSKAGADRINKVPVDMNQIIQDILVAFPHPGTSVRIDALPPASGDPGPMRQVWTNLVLNAIKYSSKKDQPEVHIGAMRQQDKIVYFVKDNGAGFDMAEAWKLFAPFKRLHTEFEGNGLGLPIVKRIIEKHGGRIWAEGKPGIGATFYFSL